ncbi:hypothetical protein ACEQPO_03265 [Bacillus sp. SL00103]
MERLKRRSLYQEKNAKKSIEIKLNKAQLKKDLIKFSSHLWCVKKKVCINQEDACQLAESISRKRLAFKGVQTKDVTLDSFPTFYSIGDQKEQTDIVIQINRMRLN